MTTSAKRKPEERINAGTVLEAARGRWREVLEALVPGIDLSGRHGPCPGCGGRDRFRVSPDEVDERGGWFCGQGGETTGGDGLALLRHVHGWSFEEAVGRVAAVLGMDARAAPAGGRGGRRQGKAAAARSSASAPRGGNGRDEAQARAARQARALCERARPAGADHPYLRRKGVQPVPGLRELSVADVREEVGSEPRSKDGPLAGRLLVAPIGDLEGVTSLELIDEKGRKAFLPGGRVKGCWWAPEPLPERPERILVAEGIATALTAREATGWPAVAALSVSGLRPVAEVLRRRHPEAHIVVLGEIGQEAAAQEAARAVEGAVAIPDFEGAAEGADLNDMAQAVGLDAVREVIERAAVRPPWHGLVPPGYRCTDDGVFERADRDDEDDVRLAHAPAWIEAVTHDTDRHNWGRLVCWRDLDGVLHREAIPADRFHGVGHELAQHLANRGLSVVPGRERRLMRYLASFRPPQRLTAATGTGWHGSAFVLPERTINEPEGARIVYQPHGETLVADAVRSSGELAAWQALLDPAPSIVRFLTGASLAAALHHPLGVESGGFHLSGATSRGKTTALQAAASVWGCGADPAVAGGHRAYILRWSATANALEALASGFNDLALVIDEVGEADARDFGRTIYRLMSGVGRARSRRDGSLAERRSWRAWLLSAGEVSVAEHIAEGGERLRGGQAVRLVDLPVEAVFETADAADRLKAGLAEHHGLAGPAFVAWVAPRLESVRARWRSYDQEAVGLAATPEARRVRRRFALVAFALELAAEAGVVPWAAEDGLRVAREAFGLWRQERAAGDEGARGILAVRDFILRHEARFQRQDGEPPRERAGWYRDGHYHFTDQAFREACAGANTRAVKRALKAAGLLHFSDVARLTARIRVDGGRRPHVVAVSERVLDYVPDEPSIAISAWDTGDTGDGPGVARASGCPHSVGDSGDSGDTRGEVGDAVPGVPSVPQAVGTAGKPGVARGVPGVPSVPAGKDKAESESGMQPLLDLENDDAEPEPPALEI
ncbi:MAG TPA: DUF927 domain-containing protein [Rhodospirillales bacterium]|nr:DUF927 domain-containing protein [Rhodospirillales bacterium]